MSCPPVDAIASIPAARCAGTPVRLMRGMVKTPVETTLATAEPEIDPINDEPMIAALAVPPVARPAARIARSMKSCPPPTAA